MPHVNIKFYPKDFTEDQKRKLADALADLLVTHMGTGEDAISISLEPIAVERWMEVVYGPEIAGKSHLLIKAPGYQAS